MKHAMIRLAALALAISMAAGLTACGGAASSGSTSTSAASDSSSTSAASQVEIDFSKNLTEDGKCSDIPLEINLGKSYVAVVDVDEAINYETGLLADHDLAASDAATAEAEAPNADV